MSLIDALFNSSGIKEKRFSSIDIQAINRLVDDRAIMIDSEILYIIRFMCDGSFIDIRSWSGPFYG